MRRVFLLCWLGIVVTGAKHPTFAQTLSLAELLPKLIAQGAVLAPPCDPVIAPPTCDQSATNHGRHFVIGTTLTSVPASLNAALALQVADFTLGPTAGGMIYSHDSHDGGGPEMHQLFGSAYADRAVPVGRGRFAMAMTYQDTNYGSLEGVDIKGGGINFLFSHAAATPGAGDVLQETLYVRLNRKVVAFLANYGVTDRVDVDVVVPIVQVALDARVASRILRVTTSQTPSVHNFDPTLRLAAPGI